MAAGLLLGPWIFDADGNGAPFVGGQLTTYVNSTTTPQATYTTSALTVPLPNPVVADANGRFPDIWGSTTNTYSIKWTDPAGVLIATYDARIPLGPSDDASFALANLSNVTPADFMTALAAASGYSAFLNRVINPACRIDQRLAGAGATLSNSAAVYGLDRFKGRRVASGTATLQQVSGGPTALGPIASSFCAHYLVGTGASPAAADQAYIETDIEGLNLADALLGTSGAKYLAVRFSAQCTLSGKQSFALQNSAQDRSYVQTYTLDTPGAWQDFSFIIPGDQGGTWLADGGIGLRLVWDAGSGSNFEGASGAWAGADRRRTSDSLKVSASSAASINISQVALYVVSDAAVIPPFTWRPYPQELALCQRYFEKLGASSGILGTPGSGAVGYATWSFKTSKRTSPTFANTGTNAQSSATTSIGADSVTVQNVAGGFAGIGSTSTADADYY